jgi:hypothetical protein
VLAGNPPEMTTVSLSSTIKVKALVTVFTKTVNCYSLKQKTTQGEKMNSLQYDIISDLLALVEQLGKIKNVIADNTRVFLDFDTYGALQEANNQLLLDAVSEGVELQVLSQEALYGAKVALGIDLI